MIKRFTVSLEEELLEDFDRVIGQQQYTNRSEAIRDLIRKTFINQQWENDLEVVGVVSLVYDHHQRQLQDRLTEVQHDYHHLIVSATHIHMDHNNCLEVVIVRGEAGMVKDLAARLTAIRGVKDGNLAMSCTGDGIS